VPKSPKLLAGRWRETTAPCGTQGVRASCWSIQIPCPCPVPQPALGDTSAMQLGTMEGASCYRAGLWRLLGWELHLKRCLAEVDVNCMISPNVIEGEKNASIIVT